MDYDLMSLVLLLRDTSLLPLDCTTTFFLFLLTCVSSALYFLYLGRRSNIYTDRVCFVVWWGDVYCYSCRRMAESALQ